MTDFSLLDIPAHIRIQSIITADQAALVMAGLIDEVDSVIAAEMGNFVNWRTAKAYKKAILDDVRLGDLRPIVAHRIDEDINAIYEIEIKKELIGVNTKIDDAEFHAADIWNWVDDVLLELEANQGGRKIARSNTALPHTPAQETIAPPPREINQESETIAVLKNRVSELEGEIETLKKFTPCHIGSFVGGADKDPLFQAIRIRNAEWVNYDPKNNDTRANQQSIITDLKDNYGFVEATAKAIEKVACPIDRNPSKTT
ncbi:hypothetical protein KSL88_12715 [Pectobacterium polaris]|uniref:hypothetical protein n=1 Tax=Pectobacterium polaris TaxID=2042057 RepID=UPI001CC42FA3|nr:hypothetical protein [Pectobacterium polaris]UAY90404.1 hypothetical protein KSL88_12715 [Pectobacterium polaris]